MSAVAQSTAAREPMREPMSVEAGWMSAARTRVEAALDAALPPATTVPARLHEAMRYATLGGGKRVRAMLVYAAGEWARGDGPASAGDDAALDAAACAVELIHAYSLVHDDLPSMDDDDLRRGRPTVHVAYDEATALLVGDALQTLAFEVLARFAARDRVAAQVLLLARASGSIGMAGGQAIDLYSVGKSLAWPELETMHRAKTGALLRAAVLLGATAAHTPRDRPAVEARHLDGGTGSLAREAVAIRGEPTGHPLEADALEPDSLEPDSLEPDPLEPDPLERFAAAVGLAFQVVDDVLDVETDSAVLGKTAGKDAMNDKPTVVTTLGLDRAKSLAQALREEAERALDDLGGRSARLGDVAAFIIGRSF